MSLLKTLTTDDTITQERDVLGGGNKFTPWDSGTYTAKVVHAYLTVAKSEAIGLSLVLESEDGRELRQTLWMTSGKEKGCKNYYTNDKGEKHYLAGFTQANHLALLTVGKEISELETETKVIPLYSYDAKAEVPTKVDMLTDLLDQEIIVGVIKQLKNKQVKGDDGKYHDTEETREDNEIDKFFRARDRKTVVEIRAQVEEATFINEWEQQWAGKVRDRTKAVNGTPGLPKAGGAAASGSSKPKTSLFA